ncbi:MAG: hypothetical protein AAF600_11550 [Bacteroidota bacterium]
MHTVITDKTDIESIEKILSKFPSDERVNIYSSKMSPIERAIVMSGLAISNVVIQQENNLILFILNNGTVLQKSINQIKGLSKASSQSLTNFENMGNGILWPEIPEIDISLKSLIQEELAQRYNLQIV